MALFFVKLAKPSPVFSVKSKTVFWCVFFLGGGGMLEEYIVKRTKRDEQDKKKKEKKRIKIKKREDVRSGQS